MKITASQAVKTTAKLQTVGKQLSLIGSNLLSGKYASAEDLKRVRASVVNASNIARRANDQILDSISSVDELKDIISCGDADVMDKAIEGSLEVATRAAMLCKAIDGELEALEPEEDEVSDEILDDEGANVEASEDERDDIDVSDDIADDVDTEASEDDTDVEDNIEDDLDVEASDDVEDIGEVDTPIVAKKKAAVATKKASVIKKQATVSRGGISWTMPSLPEAKRR